MSVLDALRALVAPPADDAPAPLDPKLAAAALLVHAATVDGTVAAEELGTLRALLKERFAMSDADADALMAQAWRREAEAVDFYAFTTALKGQSEEGRREMIEMMWRMAYADGEVSPFEDNLVWRVSELLGVSNRDRVLIKQAVADEAQKR